MVGYGLSFIGSPSGYSQTRHYGIHTGANGVLTITEQEYAPEGGSFRRIADDPTPSNPGNYGYVSSNAGEVTLTREGYTAPGSFSQTVPTSYSEPETPYFASQTISISSEPNYNIESPFARTVYAGGITNTNYTWG